MKKILYIALMKVKLNFKDRSSLAWMFLAPLLFIILVASGSGSTNKEAVKYPVTVVNQDQGAYGKELLDILRNEEAIKISEDSYDHAKSDIENSKVSLGVVIPEDFSDSIRKGTSKGIEFLKLQDDDSTITLTTIVNNAVNQVKVASSTGAAVSDLLAERKKAGEEAGRQAENAYIENLGSQNITVSASEVNESGDYGKSSLSNKSIGILVMFIMLFVARAAGSVLEEKEDGTWGRILSTPTRDSSILAGHMLGTFILGWIQVGVLILFSKYAYNIQWGNTVPGLILLFSTFLLAIIGLGTALSSLVKTKSQLTSMTNLIVIPTCLVAGCMWSRDIMPKIMIQISDFIPQTWVLKGMKDLIARGSDISKVYMPSAILMLFVGVFFIAGLMIMNARKQDA